jgi:hypothetical protein
MAVGMKPDPQQQRALDGRFIPGPGSRFPAPEKENGRIAPAVFARHDAP